MEDVVIEQITDPGKYFLDRLLELPQAAQRPIEGKAYLANILSERLLSDVCSDSYYIRLLDVNYNTKNRFTTIQSVGDDALFISGFYPESLKRKGLNVSSIEDIGRSSYYELWTRTKYELFLLLSKEFQFLRSLLFSLRNYFNEISNKVRKDRVVVI